MRSTRDDLVKAYGEPAESEIFRGGLESMKYPNLGMTFTLEAGKVPLVLGGDHSVGAGTVSEVVE